MTSARDAFVGYLTRRHVSGVEAHAMAEAANEELAGMADSAGAPDIAAAVTLARRYRADARRAVVHAELDRRYGTDRAKQPPRAQAEAGRSEAQRRFGKRGGA